MQNNNFDNEELAKFAALAASWWDPNGDLKTLHQINPLRTDYIAKQINVAGKTVLDVGCGGGILCESLATLGAKVTGIDLNASLIEVGNLHKLESGIEVEYKEESVEAHALLHAEQYDVVTCLEMLEHVPNPLSIIQACARLVKPKGHVFFSTLNRNPKSYLFAIIGAEYLLKILPKNTHDYAKFIRPSELSKWIKQVNLIPQDLVGINYNPLTQQFKLSKDISVNYLMHASKD